MSNLIVNDKFKFIHKIGKGSFGEVFKVIDNENREMACKVEYKNSSKNRLRSESRIYKRFKIAKLKCVPKVYDYIETTKHNLMTMELLGHSLDHLFEEHNNKFNIGTVLKLAVTIIDHLQNIHRIGIIHRDIKPNNFMFGLDDKKNHLYIMDFGLSKKWYEDNKHIEYKADRALIGTARYASMNVHMGIEPSRRDDMESVGYMLVYFSKGNLPWQGLKRKTKNKHIDQIGEKKMMVDLKTLCSDLPKCFYEYLNYTRNLEFVQKPNYEYMKNLFIEFARCENIELKYSWE